MTDMSIDSSEEALARVGRDSGFPGSEVGATPIMCGKDSKHRWCYAIPVPRKGCVDYAANTTAHLFSLGGTQTPDLGVGL